MRPLSSVAIYLTLTAKGCERNSALWSLRSGIFPYQGDCVQNAEDRGGGLHESCLGPRGRCCPQSKATAFTSHWFALEQIICVTLHFSHKTLYTALSFLPGV